MDYKKRLELRLENAKAELETDNATLEQYIGKSILNLEYIFNKILLNSKLIKVLNFMLEYKGTPDKYINTIYEEEW